MQLGIVFSVRTLSIVFTKYSNMLEFLFFAFQMTENSPEVVPNGYSFTEDTLKAADNEANMSPIASNGTSSQTVSQVSESSEMTSQQEVISARDAEVADSYRQNGEVTVATFSLPLMSEKRTESRQQGKLPPVENDVAVVDTFWQNGRPTTQTPLPSPSTISREQETQIRSEVVFTLSYFCQL